MSSNAEQGLWQATKDSTTPKISRVFLCHNTLDKRVVQDIAEALELEFGIPHFLDIYAIPAGEAFIPWIMRSLEASAGCAIFLGENGWGPTHLWEAELALQRYRRDPGFKLIPVHLPGLRDEDMAKLGQGTVFRSVNWVDLRGWPRAGDEVRKFRAALLGRDWEADRGPARLTPSILRRQAKRFRDSGERDTSLLYTGAELAEATRVAAEYPDLAVLGEVTPFLLACARRERHLLWRGITIAVSASLALATLALVADHQRRLAQSRQIAAQSRLSTLPETALLLAAEARHISDTLEAQAAELFALGRAPSLSTVLHGHRAGVRALAMHPKRPLLASGDETGVVNVWRIDAPASALTSWSGHQGAVYAIRHLEAPERIAVGHENGQIILWELSTGAAWPVSGLPSPTPTTAEMNDDWAGADPEPASRRGARSITAFAGSTKLLASDLSGRVFVIDPIQARTLGDPIVTDVESAGTLDVDPDGTSAIIGGEFGRIARIDLQSRAVATSKLGAAKVILARYTVTGQNIVALQSDGEITVRRALPPFDALGTYLHRPSVANADFRPGDGILAITGFDGAVDLFTIADTTITPLARFGGAHNVISSAVALRPEVGLPPRWATADVGGRVAVWDAALEHPLQLGRWEMAPTVSKVAFDTLGGVIGVTVEAEELIVTRFAQSAPVEVLRRVRARGRVMEVALNQDGSQLAVAFENGEVDVGPTQGAAPFERVGSAGDVPIRMRFSVSGARLAVGTQTGVVSAFDVLIGKRIWSAQLIPGEVVTSVAVSPDDRLVAIGTLQGTIAVRAMHDPWERFGGMHLPRHVLSGRVRPGAHAGAVLALDFSSDGRTLVSGGGGGDRQVKFWRAGQLVEQRRSAGLHSSSISAIAHSDDGRLLATASHDGVVHLWWSPEQRPIGPGLPIGRHTGDPVDGALVEQIAFSRDERLAVLAEGALYLWSINRAVWEQQACRIANRDLLDEEWSDELGGRTKRIICSIPTGTGR